MKRKLEFNERKDKLQKLRIIHPELLKASLSGNVKAVEVILDPTKPIDDTIEDLVSMFITVSQHANTHIMETLLDYPSLILAAFRARETMLEKTKLSNPEMYHNLLANFLIGQDCKFLLNIFKIACEKGDIAVMKILLGTYQEIWLPENLLIFFRIAFTTHNVEIVQIFLEDHQFRFYEDLVDYIRLFPTKSDINIEIYKIIVPRLSLRQVGIIFKTLCENLQGSEICQSYNELIKLLLPSCAKFLLNQGEYLKNYGTLLIKNGLIHEGNMLLTAWLSPYLDENKSKYVFFSKNSTLYPELWKLVGQKLIENVLTSKFENRPILSNQLLLKKSPFSSNVNPDEVWDFSNVESMGFI